MGEGVTNFLGTDGEIYAVAGLSGNGPLPVTFAGGGSQVVIGNKSNATSGQATSTNNVGTIDYNYGWNGATWDQLKTAPAITANGLGLFATGIAAVYNSPATTLTTGQWGPLQISAMGGLGMAALVGNTPVSLATAASTSANGGGSLSVGIASVFNTTPPTYTNGQYGMVQMTAKGSLSTSIADPVSGTTAGVVTVGNGSALGNGAGLLNAAYVYINNGVTSDQARSINGAVSAGSTGTGTTAVEETGRPFVNITTATTTVVKGSPGFLHTVTCNTPVASATITLFANTVGSGNKVGTITLPAVLNGGPFSITYDAYCPLGITAVTTGTADWTITSR